MPVLRSTALILVTLVFFAACARATAPTVAPAVAPTTISPTMIHPTAAVPTPPVIKISSGELQGTLEKGLHVFRGIPYAAPPVGDLRWQVPQPVPAWDGVRQTTAFGNS